VARVRVGALVGGGVGRVVPFCCCLAVGGGGGAVCALKKFFLGFFFLEGGRAPAPPRNSIRRDRRAGSLVSSFPLLMTVHFVSLPLRTIAHFLYVACECNLPRLRSGTILSLVW